MLFADRTMDIGSRDVAGEGDEEERGEDGASREDGGDPGEFCDDARECRPEC
jgi:hypothetical protein